MPLTNFPGGVASFGAPVVPEGGYFKKVLFVNNASGFPSGSGESPDSPLSSLFGAGGALAKAHPTLGTLIITGKRHAENVSAADMASDTGANKSIYILGEGEETERPTLTWTVAAATWLIDTDSIVLDNFNLNLEPGTGSVNVAAPITISGNGCTLRRIKARAGTDANNKVTVGITITGADCVLDDVYLHSATAAEATTFIRLTAASRLKMNNVRVIGATSSTGVGSLQLLTTASTNLEVNRCLFTNLKASSTIAVTGIAASSGFVRETHLHVLSDNAAALTGAWATPASVQFIDCRVTNLAGEAGATYGTVSA